MSTTEIVWRLASGVVLVALNAFFVTTEFALTRLRQLDEEELPDHPGVRRAWDMTDRLEIYLTSCQLGITASTVVLGVVTEPAVTVLIRPLAEMIGIPERVLPATSVVVAVVVLQLVHKVWGEQAPTYLGVERPVEVARYTSLLHVIFTKATYPLTWLGDKLAKWTLAIFGIEMERSWTEEGGEGEEGEVGPITSRAELRRQMGEMLTRSGVPRERKVEVVRALEIGDMEVSEIMVPREEIVALSTEASFEENMARVQGRRHARFPLVGEDLDDFRGIIYVPAVIAELDVIESGDKALSDVAVEPLSVPAGTAVSDVIDRFQEAEQELALVTEEGRVVGLVTITDAFEAIAGEVEDPYD